MVETLNWATASTDPGQQLADFDGVVHVVGDVSVTATLIAGSAINTVADYNPASGDAGSEEVGEAGVGRTVYTGGGTSSSSTLHIEDNGDSTSGYSDSVTVAFDFASNVVGVADGVENLNFWISDIDVGSWDDVLTFRVYDLDGALLPSTAITFASLGVDLSESGGTISVVGTQNSIGADPDTSVNIQVAGPISRIEIDYGNDSSGGQRIEISDLTYDPTIVTVCFVAGTRIMTENGDVAVEDLREGDLVASHGNGLLPIRWIGKRTINASGALAPICISKGALGNSRDLMVSPAHRMMVSGTRASVLFAEDEVLVAAKDLVDGDMIYRAASGEVTYYHILFDHHAVIFAEGAPAESLYLSGETLKYFDQDSYDEILALFPELAAKGSFDIARPVLSADQAKLLLN